MTTAVAFEATPVQVRLMDAITDGESRIIGFGGGIRGTKALALDTPIPTPSGWTTMAAIAPGDVVFGSDGLPCHVVDVAPVIENPIAYRVTFSDGSAVDACADHLWKTFTRAERIALSRRTEVFRADRRAVRASRATGSRGGLVTALVTERNHTSPPAVLNPPAGAVRTTRQIAESLSAVHGVRVAGALTLPAADLPIDPYLLGVWLGDGTTSTGTVTTGDTEIQQAFAEAGFAIGATQSQENCWTFRVHGLTAQLRALGVLNNKHIPTRYLRGSEEQRRSLLCGLMDTDGTCGARGRIRFVSTRRALAEGCRELVLSLGMRASWREMRSTLSGRDCGPCWSVEFRSPAPVFRLARKASRQRAPGAASRWRYIVSCERIDSVPMRCITVSSSDQLYLAGRAMIPTHNTWGSLSALITLCKIFPGSRWAVIRKDLQRLRDTTIPSFDKLRQRTGGFIGPVNQQTWNATCTNGSVLLFRGENIDRDPELLRFHGYEVNGFLNEEADELSERTLVKEIERAGTWIIPTGNQPPAYILNTFNPCSGWPRRRFYMPWRAGSLKAPYKFIPSTAADNPYISDAQRDAWKEMPENEYRRFVMGDWESLTGAYYDTLDASVHIVPRSQLPAVIPEYWRFWGSFDWGYRHWAVMGAWVTDMDGTDYLLDSMWLRRMQDDELAKAYKSELPAACLKRVFAGHDCWAKPTHHGASGVSTAEVFHQFGIELTKADVDTVNGGRAVNRAFKVRDGRSDTYIVQTPGNMKVFDQMSEIIPDENDIRRPKKIDADDNGVGGDDGADMVRHAMGSRQRPAKIPDSYEHTGQEPHHDPAIKLTTKDGKPPRWIGPGDAEHDEWSGGYADQLPAGI